jgi:hypothetical protein
LLQCKLTQLLYPLQVYGESEVKAQIKLRVTTGAQMPVVIIRSYQVCVCRVFQQRCTAFAWIGSAGVLLVNVLAGC